jgi:SAM-dependent methyltransferase
MDKLIITAPERQLFPEAYRRDCWVKAQAESLAAGSWVLDAGAGASKYRPYFSHCRYETQDFCEYQGDLVKYLKAIDYVSDITAIPLPDHQLDAILCTEVLEHVPDPMAVLREFSRLLKGGGKLFLTAPMLSFLHMEPYHYYGGFTLFWYKHWLPQFGFNIESTVAYGGPGQSYRNNAVGFFVSWMQAEHSLKGSKRRFSKITRLMLKALFCSVPIRLFPKWDRWLGADKIACGWMVACCKEGGAPATERKA